jgi:hypothetical protein
MPIQPSQAKNDIYLGTNSASSNRFDSLSMTYAKNARQLPSKDSGGTAPRRLFVSQFLYGEPPAKIWYGAQCVP